MNRDRIKIFVTFFVLSSLFTYWTSWNEETNFLLTKTIVDNGIFYLDEYRNKIGDVIYLDNHYFARISRWIISTLSTFLYFFLKILVNDENSLKFLLSIFTSTLFFSLSTLLVYNLSKKFIKNIKHRVLIPLIYGFSTPVFQQARFFTTHSTETFFTVLTIYLLFKVLENNELKYTILSGIFIGLGLLLTPVLIIFFILVVLILWLKNKKKECLVFFFITLFICLPFYITYYLVVKLPMITIVPLPIFTSVKFFTYMPFFPETFKFDIFPLSNFLQLLIFPSKGIFFYYPILILSFIGFFISEKHKIVIFVLSFLILFTILGISIMSIMWWGGWVSYGSSRILTVLTPFFSIGLMSFVDKFGFKLIIPFMLISTFNNFLLLQYGEDKISTLSWEEYEYKMKNFHALSNPLFEHYLPLTIINGPRSILLENLIIHRKIDINLKHPFNPITPEFIPNYPIIERCEIKLLTLPIGILVLKLPWLSMFILLCILVLIWRNEIFKKIKLRKEILLLIVITIFIFCFLRIREHVLLDGWYAPDADWYYGKIENGRWFGEKATILLFSNKNQNKTMNFIVKSFLKTRSLQLLLNDNLINEYKISGEKKIVQFLQLKEGENKIEFISKYGCDKPLNVGLGNDVRCLSFKIDF
ncbi:MAG: glycosyltransferase family 39 protein [Candidatus Aenigmatarchaeota archaeon]